MVIGPIKQSGVQNKLASLISTQQEPHKEL